LEPNPEQISKEFRIVNGRGVDQLVVRLLKVASLSQDFRSFEEHIMKRLFFLLLLLGAFGLKSQEIKWVTFEEAVELNKTVPKKLLVDLYTDWCGWCKKMDRDTYANAAIINVINANFYPVKFNAEQRESVTFDGHTFKFIAQGSRGVHELAAALTQNKLSYPTTVFMDEQVRIIQPLPGYMGPDQMLPILKYIGEDHFKTTSWEDYQKAYSKAQ
jgi:thioredoxin-related protein